MITLSNALSLLRAPLALLFLVENTSLRIGAIIVAMITDGIDGYIARRNSSVTKLGAVLDPIMDKFFVLMVLGVLFLEARIPAWSAAAMMSRDFFLCLFALYLTLFGKWSAHRFKAIRWGKITTALQFLFLIGLTLNYVFPFYLYAFFVLFGILAFIELIQSQQQLNRDSLTKL